MLLDFLLRYRRRRWDYYRRILAPVDMRRTMVRSAIALGIIFVLHTAAMMIFEGLVFGDAAARAGQFQVNFAHTENSAGERSGADAVEEAFVIYKPTGQILWALVDGAGQDSINLQIGAEIYDLLG